MVRTRFAPSPTGFMHVGNLRTALYEYLVAKSQGGTFVLRIEDTDQERYVEGATDVIYRTLQQVGLKHDEGPDVGGAYGPYIQSERKDLYKPYAEQLVREGKAYYCFCTKERLESIHVADSFGGYDRHCRDLPAEEVQRLLDAGTPYVIRQKMPLDGATSFEDAVYGTITIENESGRRVDFTVTGIVENYVYHYLYISPELYTSEMNEPFEATEIDAVCVKTEPEERAAVASLLQEQEGVATAGFTEDTRASFDDLVESLNSIILVIIFCAGALAFVVLYNLTNINVTERQRELATIKVLGFRDGEVAGYIYRETSLLTLLGCAAGLGFGVLMHAFVIQTVEVDMVMFGRTVEPLSFVWSALLTLLFAVIVDFVMFPKLKRIDMVESLKSVD